MIEKLSEIDYVQRYCIQLIEESKWCIHERKLRSDRLRPFEVTTIHEEPDRYYTGVIDAFLLLLEAINDIHEVGYPKKLDEI